MGDKREKKSLLARFKHFFPRSAGQAETTQQAPAPRQSIDDATTSASLELAHPEAFPDPSEATNDHSTDKLWLWNKAYKKLRDDVDTKAMVLEYEDFLRDPKNELVENESDLSRPPQQKQMEAVLRRSLNKTAKLDKLEAGLGSTIDIVLQLKDLIGVGVSPVPIAAAAWTPISISLGFLAKSLTENQENRKGVVEIVKKMNWYTNLSLLQLADTTKDERYNNLRSQLADRICELHEALLHYLIKTVCVRNEHPFVRGWKNLGRSWKEEMSIVESAETTVKDFAEQHCSQQMITLMHGLLGFHLTKEDSEVVAKLSAGNMYDEMTNLEKRKDSLITDSHQWVLEKDEWKHFLTWDAKKTCQVLWIKGEAGTGKTMLVIGLVRALNPLNPCYFFCQGINDKLNSAIAILKGLMSMLITQQRSLVKHLSIEIGENGNHFLTDTYAFQTLKRIFLDMICDHSLEQAVFVVDALDECKESKPNNDGTSTAGLVDLLEVITESVKKSDKVKWLISGRNIKHIAEALVDEESKGDQNFPVNDSISDDRTAGRILPWVYESVEVNREAVANVLNSYITSKIDGMKGDLERNHTQKDDKSMSKSEKLALQKQVDVLDRVEKTIKEKTGGTFLWVSLVFRELENCELLKMPGKLAEIPSDLKKLYARMAERISLSSDKDSYRKVISVAVLAHRPLGVREIMMLATRATHKHPEDFLENSGMLTVRDGVVYLLHQSTLEYLKERPDDHIRGLFPEDHESVHIEIVERSLRLMGLDLENQEMRSKDPSTTREELSDLAYLVTVRYACRHWIDHFCDIPKTARGSEILDKIWAWLKYHLLDWLVALCLTQELEVTMPSISRFRKLLQHEQPNSQLSRLVGDTDRFCRLAKDGIEEFPLQVYCSASLFPPASSRMRELFQSNVPDFIATAPIMEDDWDACQQTYRVRGSVQRLFLEGGRCATASDTAIEFTDLYTGAASLWPEPMILGPQCIAFSPDGNLLALASSPREIEVWNVTERRRLPEFRLTPPSSVYTFYVQFSPSRPEIAIGFRTSSHQCRVAIYAYGLETGFSLPSERQIRLDDDLKRFLFSADGAYLATWGTQVRLWNVVTGDLKSMVASDQSLQSLDLNAEGNLLATVDSIRGGIVVWNVEDPIAALLRTFSRHGEIHRDITSRSYNCVAFSPDSQMVAGAFIDDSIHLLDVHSGEILATLPGHVKSIYSLSFSGDGILLASASYDGTAKLWTIPKDRHRKGNSHNSRVNRISMSPNRAWFVSGSADSVKVWDIDGTCARTLAQERSDDNITISPGSNLFATIHNSVFLSEYDLNPGHPRFVQESYLKVWNKSDDSSIVIRETEHLRSTQFSPCGTVIAAGTRRGVKMWSIATKDSPVIWEMQRGPYRIRFRDRAADLTISADGRVLAAADHSSGPFIRIWNISDSWRTEPSLSEDLNYDKLRKQGSLTFLAVSENGKRLLSGTSPGRVQIWDVQSKTLLHDLRHESPPSLSFIDNGPLVRSNRGAFELPPDPAADEIPARDTVLKSRGPGISKCNAWITWNGQNLLWLPPPYRPTASDVRDRTVVIGCASGQVYVIAFKDGFDGFEAVDG